MSVSQGFAVPKGLVRTTAEMRGPEGLAWLERLPAIVADCARRWSLTIAPPFAELSINYVAPGVRADGTAVVLKVCFPDHEFFTEVGALQLFAGRGALRLLAVDLDQGALLLERLRPGTPLIAIADDHQATHIAASVMRRLWRPVPADHSFPSVADWVLGMAKRAPRLIGPGSPFPARWIDYALGLFAELSASPVEPLLLHGDLHHGNILAAEREPWLAIDPKGVVGEPLWETGPLLFNALPSPLDVGMTRQILTRRVEQLAEELGFDRARLAAQGVVRTVLAGFWMVEDHGHGWEMVLTCAEILAGIRG